jgi:hypothetical protein
MNKIKLYEEFLNEGKVGDAIKDVAKTAAKKAGKAALKYIGGQKLLSLADQMKKNKEKANKLAQKAQKVAKSDKPTSGLEGELTKVQQKITNLDAQKIALKQKEVQIKGEIDKTKAATAKKPKEEK